MGVIAGLTPAQSELLRELVGGNRVGIWRTAALKALLRLGLAEQYECDCRETGTRITPAGRAMLAKDTTS